MKACFKYRLSVYNYPKDKTLPTEAGSVNLEEQRDEEWLVSILTKLFQKREEEVIINIFYEAGVTLKPKSNKDSVRERNYMLFLTYEHRYKSTNYSIYKQSSIGNSTQSN